MNKPSNISQLRDGLSDVFSALGNGNIETPVAKEMNNTAGKIVATLRVELQNAQLRKEKPEIKYLASPPELQL